MPDFPRRHGRGNATQDDLQKLIDVLSAVITPSGSSSSSGSTIAGAFNDTLLPDAVTLAAASVGTAPTPSRGDHHHPLNQDVTPTWSGAHVFQASISTSDVLPRTAYTYSLGSISYPWLTAHIAELVVRTLVAQDVLATVGGNVEVAPTTKLTVALSGTNSVQEPGFETWNSGYPYLWGFNNPADGGSFSQEVGSVHGGSNAVKLTAGTTAGHNLNQVITGLTAATTYFLSFWTRGDATYAGRYRVTDYTHTDADITALTATGITSATYTRVLHTFTTPAGCTSARIWFYCPSTNTGVAYFDDVVLVPATITVEHNSLTSDATAGAGNGDNAYLQARGAVEFIRAVTGPAGSGPYTYTVYRDLDGTGPNTWQPGDAVVNTGTTGDGFMDIYAVSGVNAATTAGPTIVGNRRTGTGYADWTECVALGNLKNLYQGYSSDTYGFAAGAKTGTWLAVDATNGLRMMSNTTQLAQWDTSGNILVGQAAQENLYITSTALQIRNSTTVLASLDGSTLTLGNTVQEHVNLTATALELKNGATVYASLDGSTLTLGNTTDADYVQVDPTNGVRLYGGGSLKIHLQADGSSSFEGVINVGTSGGIFQGTGTFASPTTALKIYNSGGVGLWELWGSGTKQVYAGTDGYLYAGGGSVKLDSNGLSIVPGATTANAVSWYIPSTTDRCVYMAGNYTALTKSADAYIYASSEDASGIATLRIGAFTNTGMSQKLTNIEVYSDQTDAAFNKVLVNITGTSVFQLRSDYHAYAYGRVYPGGSSIQTTRYLSDDGSRTAVSAGLNVATDLLVGTTITPSGNYQRTLGGSTYVGGIFVPLTTPLTSASWDGDAYSTTAATIIDMSAVFSVPANVKAVYLRAMARDSAAWGTDGLYVTFGPSDTNYGAVTCPAFGGDVLNDGCGIVPCNADGDIYYSVAASGASTLDVWVWIYGYFV